MSPDSSWLEEEDPRTPIIKLQPPPLNKHINNKKKT